MFHYLKRRLGIDALEERFQFYHKYWMQMEQRFKAVNDHLVEIKEILNDHDVLSDKKALNYHLDIMARLGMLLSEMEKVKPKELAQKEILEILAQETKEGNEP